MRRMYSEQELTNVIKAVFEQELEDGALDENVADAVDDYLTEHPVDITALEGQDISCNSVDADATITGAEIVEKMSGYRFTKATNTKATYEYIYAGVVKNGNKLTFAIAMNITRTDDFTSASSLGVFTIPSAVSSKLYPTSVGAYNLLSFQDVTITKDGINQKSVACQISKSNVDIVTQLTNSGNLNTQFTLTEKYYVRVEMTFLLSDSLVSE